MSDIAIRVENLGKRYKLGGQKSGSFRESLSRMFRKPQSGNGRPEVVNSDSGLQTPDSAFWALKDINFEIKRGEAVGIIGRNGAGKSTLLKILSRITEPTKGRYEIFGRVSSLLEVGTGFHPELTGRENVYLNGTILGMKRWEVKAKFDEIVAFSGVEKFIDTPVKHYSSGMQVRLAFAVAAHLEPEILIIDEVLAAGDAEFQKKCLGKMEDVTGEGRTVIFVSHNMGAVEHLCDRVIYLETGGVFLDGYETIDIIGRYLSKFEDAGADDEYCRWIDYNEKLFSNEYHSIDKIELNNEKSDLLTRVIPNSTAINITVEGKIFKVDPALNIGYAIYHGNSILFWSWLKDHSSSEYRLDTSGDFKLRTKIPPNFLNKGKYTIEFFSVLHQIKPLIKKGEGVRISFEIEGSFEDVRLHPKFEWVEEYN